MITVEAPGAAPQMMPLKVVSVGRIAEEIHLFDLREPQGRDLPPFTAGAHITVRAPNGALRKYSLCNAPRERDRYHIAVRKDAAGRGGSISLVDSTAAGDTVQATAPENTFPLSERAE